MRNYRILIQNGHFMSCCFASNAMKFCVFTNADCTVTTANKQKIQRSILSLWVSDCKQIKRMLYLAPEKSIVIFCLLGKEFYSYPKENEFKTQIQWQNTHKLNSTLYAICRNVHGSVNYKLRQQLQDLGVKRLEGITETYPK